jgi:hypothetical protein
MDRALWLWTRKRALGLTISLLILKKIVHVRKRLLTVLFNFSLLFGAFLCVWKESYVVPLVKSGDKGNISNYRGISILSVIPKAF